MPNRGLNYIHNIKQKQAVYGLRRKEQNMKAHYWVAGLLAAYAPLALAQDLVVLGATASATWGSPAGI